MTNYETITVEKRDKVAVLTINRPDKLNALNKNVHAEGVAALEELRKDDSVRVVVITGAGEKSFVAGADISEFAGETRVERVGRDQLVVSACRHKSAAIDHEDPIRAPDRRESVGDDDRRASSTQTVERMHEPLFGQRVQR